MDLGLAGATAVVTGGSKGMGLAIAQTLAAEGARVAVMARGRVALDTATESLLAAGAPDAVGISVDMSADYCRLATWRTTNPDQLAKAAMQVKKPVKKVKPGDGQPQLDFGGA